MDPMSTQGSVPSGVLYGGMVLWLARELWGAVINRKKEKTETEANVTLVKGLTERIEGLEKSITTLEGRLTEEMRVRMDAQEENHQMKMRISTLEHTLRGLGATIPEMR